MTPEVREAVESVWNEAAVERAARAIEEQLLFERGTITSEPNRVWRDRVVPAVAKRALNAAISPEMSPLIEAALAYNERQDHDSSITLCTVARAFAKAVRGE